MDLKQLYKRIENHKSAMDLNRPINSDVLKCFEVSNGIKLPEKYAPYIRIPDVKGPNTSLSLWDIAERIAIVRGTTTEKIIELTTKNAERLFDAGYGDV